MAREIAAATDIPIPTTVELRAILRDGSDEDLEQFLDGYAIGAVVEQPRTTSAHPSARRIAKGGLWCPACGALREVHQDWEVPSVFTPPPEGAT